MISKSLSTSQRFARLFTVIPDLAEFAQSLYPLLMAHTDDFGRQAGDLFTVQHKVHPASPRSTSEFQAALQAMHHVGLIVWYQDGRVGECIQMVKFDQHQVGLHKRTRSEYPKPPENSGKFPEPPGNDVPGNFPEIPSQVPDHSAPTELKRTELKRTEEDQDPRARRAPQLISFQEARPHLVAAAHAFIEEAQGISDIDLMEQLKKVASKLRCLCTSGQLGSVIDAVRGERKKRVSA